MGKILISDESINRNGFRVLTVGINISDYKQNPILLWMHNRAWRGSQDDVLPIGRIINLSMEGSELFGEPEFDVDDPFAKQISDKFEKGFLKAISAGLEPVEWSEDVALMMPGQTKPTLTKSVLFEVSIVDISSNCNTLALYNRNHELIKEDQLHETIQLMLKPNPETITNPKPNPMKKIALFFGLPEDATEEQILAKASEVKLALDEKNALLLKYNDEKATALVEGAIASKKIAPEKKDTFLKLAKSDYDQAKDVIDGIQLNFKPTDFVKPGSGKPEAGNEEMTYPVLLAKGREEYDKFKSEHPAEFAAIYKKEYGIDYKPSID